MPLNWKLPSIFQVSTLNKAEKTVCDSNKTDKEYSAPFLINFNFMASHEEDPFDHAAATPE